jgi:hypothetical protein
VQEVIELPVSKIKPAAGMVHTIPITDVVFSQKHYTRTESQSPAKVQEYAKSIADGEFPPILLSCSDDPALCDILLDGWHRWMARKERHLETIDVEYIDIDGMDIHEIRRKAARSNFRHGVPQTEKELEKLIRDEYRAKMESLDQAGREALKQAMAADYSRSLRYIRDATSRIDKDYKAELRDTAFEMWLACNTQDQIAEAVGFSRPAISQFLESLQLVTNGTGAVCDQMSENGEVANPEELREFDESDEGDHSNSLGTYQLDKRLLIKANHLDEHYHPPIYNVWKQQDRSDQVSHFGNSEIDWLDNLLYLYTKPFDVVIDPFAGGGSTIDLCKARLRRYLVSDRKPIDIRSDIRQHDITDGVLSPPKWKDVRLVYLDPPYWKQAEGRYSEDPTDLANVDLAGFNEALSGLIKQYAEKLKRSRSESASYIALLIQPTQWNAPDRQFIDHVGDMLRAVSLPVEMRISVPYESQQCTPQMVNWAKENHKVLVLSRELVIWRVA